MQAVTVSVIVPCYNQAQYLEEALDSVLNQSYTAWECLIVNDGSTDTTEEVANRWMKKDTRFKSISISNGGLANARNTGIREAEGIFILPLDADDTIAPDYLKLAIDAYSEDSELKLVYCNAEKFGTQNGLWELSDFSLKKLAVSNMIFCTAFFRKEDWNKVGGYDRNMKYGWEDWEFWIALLKNGGAVKRLDYTGFFYRINENSMLRSMGKSQEKELFDYMSVKHADFYVKYVGNFQNLMEERYIVENKLSKLLASKKHACNVLCNTVLGWKPFKLNQKD